MNKSDLVSRMTERLGGDRKTAAAAVNGVLEEIESSVARGERVSLTGFGTFDRRERGPRTGRNPRTGEAIQVGASVAPVFRAGTGFRSLLAQAGDGAPARTSKSAATEDPDPKATEKKEKKSAAAASTVTKAVTADAGKSGKKAAKKAANKAAKKAAKKAR